MPTLELLCKSKDNKTVFFDPLTSHAATHFDDAPTLKALVIEVLENRELTGSNLTFDIDMGRIIGNSDVVDIEKNDELVYAIRRLREDQGYVPFTKSRGTQPSSYLSIYLVAKDASSYELSSAWVGEFEMPPFPQMANATKDSISYWRKHAFVWGSQKIVPGTEISICPW